MNTRAVTIASVTVAALAALTVAACGGSSTPAATGGTSPAAAAHPATSAPAEPDTAAAAVVAANRYFALASADQWAAAYLLIDPAQRAQVPESLFTGFHGGCKSLVDGATIKATNPVLANPTTAVVTVSLAGAGSALGSAQDTMIYTGGQWYGKIDDSDMTTIYAGHTVAQAIAAANAQGLCAS